MADDGDRRFDRPRMYGAMLMFTAIVLLVTADALSADYMADPVTLGILGALGLALVGIEASDFLRRGD